ncbi:MAG: DNA translocase FtsK 4TM domain-containing protein [Pseudobdellovibrionaceae bacterium]
MSRSLSSAKPSPFLQRILPEDWHDYLAHKTEDAKAVALGLVGLFLLASLLTYHSSDPSLNTAASPDLIANLGGIAGAYIADMFIQVFGIGSLVFSFGLIAWGVRVWRRESFGPLWLRFAAITLSALLLGTAGGAVPSPFWISHATLGGAGGVLILNHASAWIQDVAGFPGHVLLAIISGGTGLILAGIGIALHRSERHAIVASFLSGGSATWEGASSLWDRFAFWRGGKDTAHLPEDEEDESYDIDPVEDEDTEDEDDIEDDARATLRSKRAIAVVKADKEQVSKTSKVKKSAQKSLNFAEGSEWELPPIDLLQEVPPVPKDDKLDEGALRKNAELLQNVLSDYNVKGDISSIHPGPVVTLYELEPAPGTKTSRVVGLSDDIARSMSAVSVRCAVVPGRNVIGIELPNKRRQTVFLRDLMEDDAFEKTQAKLPLILGKDIGGHPVIADLARMPHLLVAGTTGSGKSVGVNTMILSLLYRLSPEKCRFIMIDPKMLELSVYNDIPHLLSPVVTEAGRAVVALKWTVQEMENRYRNMSKLGVRNIEGYNARIKEAVKKGEILMRKVQTGFDPETGKPVYEEQPLDLTELPYIVVVVDEFADLMLVAGKDVENAIQRLAQMARAAGIHLIMATQRPSVDVITGVIKANFPTRISFQVTSKIDSRTILGEGGAETLLGMGDMLYMAAGGRITRVHGPFVSDREVEDVVNYLKAQGEPAYLEDVTEGDLFGLDEDGEDGESENSDELYDEAVAIVAREGKASTSFIQRHLQIGYNRAARIMEQMEKEGVVSPANRTGKREVLVGAR